MQLNAEMGSTMTERFNVAGRDARQAVRPPARGVADVRGERLKVREIGVTRDMYGSVFMIAVTLLTGLITAVVYGVGGTLVIRGSAPVRHAGRAGAAAHPRLRADRVAVQRAGPGDDLAGQLRPGLRGARPGAADHREAGRGRRCPPGSARHRRRTSGSTDVSFRYPTAAEVSLASLESIALKAPERTDAAAGRAARRLASPPPPGSSPRSSARPARARRRSPSWSRGCTTPTTAPC